MTLPALLTMVCCFARRYYRGSDLQVRVPAAAPFAPPLTPPPPPPPQNYFTMILENKLRVAIKPQLDAAFARRLKGKIVRDLISSRDERGVMDKVVADLDLGHVLDREVQQLSGGELQR